MEGHSVTLHTDTQLHTHDVIEWMFGVQTPDEIIAEINREDNTKPFISERLKNHVEIDDQTGSLIITNITTQHTGRYQLEITRKPSSHIRHFNLTVYAGLSVPVISRVSSQCSSSSSSSCCCVLCSVMNVSHDVSVSWYKGKSLLSSISVSDLNIRLSLPLEVEYQDTNTYRCVVNNPITNLTQHLHITQLCHMSSDQLNPNKIVEKNYPRHLHHVQQQGTCRPHHLLLLMEHAQLYKGLKDLSATVNSLNSRVPTFENGLPLPQLQARQASSRHFLISLDLMIPRMILQLPQQLCILLKLLKLHSLMFPVHLRHLTTISPPLFQLKCSVGVLSHLQL
ncbi:uncharacterized protein LOC130429819 [Triplophysa dalaica]|uniref:uncharacterized protein LOC130429819 n=1 Tax=Triplophysa dalaica TaxID=1582913 RepID=UPI0024E030C5|nr:uncharacterized protein LOC130429819 [Triplophysa dalaica]